MSPLESRRKYIEGEVRERLCLINEHLGQGGFAYTMPPEEIGKIKFSFDGIKAPQHAYLLEDGFDDYTIGRNVGRVFLRHFNPGLSAKTAYEAEKIRRVVYHLFGIVNIVTKDPEADIDGFPEIYKFADDVPIPFTLRETVREKTERLTGKIVELPDTPPQEDKEQGFVEEDGISGKPIWKASPPKFVDPKLDGLADPEVEARKEYLERKKDDMKFDPNQAADFGYGFDVVDLGYETDENDELIRREVDSVRFDGLANERHARMSEEFQVARAIFLGRGENWQTVLCNLLLSDEETSIKYLKGIYN